MLSQILRRIIVAFTLGIVLWGCGKPNDAVTLATQKLRPANASLLPLAVGKKWRYRVKTMGAHPACPAGDHDETILGTQAVGGRTAFRVRSFCSASGESLLTADGDKVDFYFQGQWLPVLALPLKEGHTWTYVGPVKFRWKKVGAQTTPAGRFNDCWKREQVVAYEAYTIFCRGAGMTRSYSRDNAGSGWDAELLSLN